MEKEKRPDINFNQCLNLPITEHKNLPTTPAVYVMYAPPNIVLYVGACINLRNRWQEHGRRYKKELRNARVAWFPLPVYLHREIERALISTHLPVINNNHKPKGSPYIYYQSFHKLRKYIQKQRLAVS